MRLIDADALRKQLISRQIIDAFSDVARRHEIGCIVGMVDKQPTIDAVPMVRCKCCNKYDCRKTQGLLDVTPDDFCSYGEGRSDACT